MGAEDRLNEKLVLVICSWRGAEQGLPKGKRAKDGDLPLIGAWFDKADGLVLRFAHFLLDLALDKKAVGCSPEEVAVLKSYQCTRRTQEGE
jgi:hypothetical protein